MASDPGVRTLFRQALQIALEAYFKEQGDALAFQGGTIEGPQADRDIGCVWWAGKRPAGKDGNNEETFFQVRVLRRFRQDQGGETPREDTAELLERTAETLEDALASVLTRPWLQAAVGDDVLLAALGPEYFVVTELVTNYPGQYVEATLQTWLRNRTARGG